MPVIDSISGVASKPARLSRGAQHVGQPLQHVDADRPRAGRVIARQRVMPARHLGQVGDRHQPRRRAFGKLVEPVVQRPEHQPQPGRRGLQQQRQEDRVLAEAHAVLAQRRRAPPDPAPSRRRRHRSRGSTPSASTSRKAKPRASPVSVSSRLSASSGSNSAATLRSMKCCKPAAHLLGDVEAGLLVDEGLDLRAAAHRRPAPACRPRARPTSGRPAR